MKKLLLSIMLLSAIPLAAQASCETVKADISQKLSKMVCQSLALRLMSYRTIRLTRVVVRLWVIAKTTHRRSSISAQTALKTTVRQHRLHTNYQRYVETAALWQPFLSLAFTVKFSTRHAVWL